MCDHTLAYAHSHDLVPADTHMTLETYYREQP